ncbi:hypothetical protein HYPSUDRAFT_40127 [Hypholoma sublateritium FD-334 SS-4]|uniref:BTB domain-containing protein n=1 Tax=Hypholoma sublateritium (strain FD-334 SS-4) TaxID=945553 RepID=A0A0D2PUM4_HYPSF|nr:hypothetical protein HYPSUDRAFT_40127 [Hypholoma sublateritium FD-334 SS-4]
MVSLVVLNPAHKLRFLSKLILKGSSRMLKGIDTSVTPFCTPPLAEEFAKPEKFPKTNASPLVKLDLSHIPEGGLTLDTEYYKPDYEGGLCTFRVENTLFRVHKCYLLREPSAFGDMFALPLVGQIPGASPIPLYDTAVEFRDLLWALYALPTHLISTGNKDCPSIGRLLNIAKLANKYCMASYETWALQEILALAQDPMGFLRSAPSEVCALALNVAVLCHHDELLDLITHRLVARILWTDVAREPIVEVAESRGSRRLQGVLYYKELVSAERNAKPDGARKTPLVFPASISAEKRKHLLAAHHSLVNLCEWVRTNPPMFVDNGCTSHAECLTAWSDLWLSAGSADQTMRHGPTDVLGRLKAMMILLKKWMLDSASPITIDCTMAALESITVMRDDIVSGLLDHFQV